MVILPANTLTYSLIGAPAGASIDPQQVPSHGHRQKHRDQAAITFAVRVTDNGTPNLFDEETITVTVNEVNAAPVLGAIGDQTIA